MRKVRLYAYDGKAGETVEVAAITLDGGELSGEGDEKTVAFVLGEPITAKGGGRRITSSSPEEFLDGLQWHYRSVILSAGPPEGS